LIDKIWHSSPICISSFRGIDHDTAHYLVVEKIRERPSVSKQGVLKFELEKCNLEKKKKLNDVDVKEQYQFRISNRFARLELLDDNVDIIRAWEIIRENTKTLPKRV
jgi:hypothetical protein